MKQQKFGFFQNLSKEHGGSLLEGKRKTARPLSTKSPLHCVLKSSEKNPLHQNRRCSLFNSGNRKLETLIHQQANKYKITIYRISLNWSHIHAVMKVPSRQAYKAFIKTVTAFLVSYLSKVKAKDCTGLFDLRPWTRILSWGREFQRVMEYSDLNDLEARGWIRREKKKIKQNQMKNRKTRADPGWS